MDFVLLPEKPCLWQTQNSASQSAQEASDKLHSPEIVSGVPSVFAKPSPKIRIKVLHPTVLWDDNIFKGHDWQGCVF